MSKIYLHSDAAEKVLSYKVNIAPAGDTAFIKAADCPTDWLQADGNPVQFVIDFAFGAAEVDTKIANYMVARGIAHRSRMARRIGQLFDAAGNAVVELFDSKGRSVAVHAPE